MLFPSGEKTSILYLEGSDEGMALEGQDDGVDAERDAVDDLVGEAVVTTGSIRGCHAPGLTSGLDRPQVFACFDLDTNLSNRERQSFD